jgi:hypothetical protein
LVHGKVKKVSTIAFVQNVTKTSIILYSEKTRFFALFFHKKNRFFQPLFGQTRRKWSKKGVFFNRDFWKTAAQFLDPRR